METIEGNHRYTKNEIIEIMTTFLLTFNSEPERKFLRAKDVTTIGYIMLAFQRHEESTSTKPQPNATK